MVSYYTKTTPLNGKIKERIEDFIVEEIQRDGRVSKVEVLCDRLKTKEVDLPQKIVVPENTLNKEYLHFDVEKFNMDEHFLIKKLARWLRVSKTRFTYSGVKDKRAVTSQDFAIWKPKVEFLEKFNSKALYLKNFSWQDKKIELGDHKGNAFNIIVRDIPHSIEETTSILEQFSEQIKDGLPNYFGVQRFGQVRPTTHLVGKKIFEGDIKGAVMLYLAEPFKTEPEDCQVVRQALKDSYDFSAACRDFPDHLRYEKAMLNHLIKNPDDFIGALRVLPKSFRIMFSHAYQSYIYNLIIEERLKHYTLAPIPGDVLDESGAPTASLFGFKSEFREGVIGDIERKILENEGITFKNFYVKDMTEMSTKGAIRAIALYPKEFKIVEVKEDDLVTESNNASNKVMANITFYLGKGSYATTVLDELNKKN